MSQADRQRAARMAYRVLLREGTGRLPADVMGTLSRCRDTELLTWSEAADRLGIPPERFAREHRESCAFTLFMDGRRQICYEADANVPRVRFTLAHELGHIALRHDRQACGEAGEREADCFASHFLVPRPALRYLMENAALTGLQLSRYFFVSPACMRHILREGSGCPLSLEEENAVIRLFEPAMTALLSE